MSILLLIHITSMLTSLVITSAMGLVSASAYRINGRIVSGSFVVTSLGVLSGIVLLTQYPLDLKCAALFAYVLAFGAVYRYVTRQNQLLSRSES